MIALQSNCSVILRADRVTDFGAFGSLSWLDTRRMIGGYVAIDDYYSLDAGAVRDLVKNNLIPLIEQIVDEGRAATEP